jgi:virulence factor Mce-like protein
VLGVTVDGRDARVTMRIGRQYAPLRQGTVARIRYSTLLAQKYIELTPSASGDAVADGGSLQVDETVTPVDFDQFISALDPKTREAVQQLVQNAGAGVDGQGATLNDTLDQLNGLSVESQVGLETLQRHNQDSGAIAHNLAVVAARLARSHEELGSLVSNADVVTGTLAERDADLNGFIKHAGSVSSDFSDVLNGNEGNLHTVATQLGPVMTSLNQNLGVVYPLIHDNLRTFYVGVNTLIPEIDSAIAQGDSNGNWLRQWFVNCQAYDTIGSPYSQTCPAAAPAAGAPRTPAPASTPPPSTAGPGSLPGLGSWLNQLLGGLP